MVSCVFVCIRVYKLQNYKKHANLHSCRSVFACFIKKRSFTACGSPGDIFRGHKSAFVADFVNFAKNNALKSVELLAPAKDFQSAVAAVDYGADAVYIGGAKFGARYAAGNSAGEIARVVEYAHRYGVRVHATLNTLIYDDELEAAGRQARELIAAGVDALIVQDMALRRMNLPVELHASTQMCNMAPAQARFLGECGFARVILERALSLGEIRDICAATAAEVECFVHGAICVGYSGRCFLSRSVSDRSGNRGACSQPCRLTYDLTDGRGRTYIAGKHLLSVRDLNLSAHIGELLDAGVTSFKIEGRLKDVGYIKNVVAYYRREVDAALAGRPHLRRASAGESIPDFTPDTAKSFTRGESEYFFAGKRPGVASFDTPKAVGEYVGRVVRVEKNRFRLDRGGLLAAGDGICFLTDRRFAGTNVNAADGDCVTPNRMEGIVPGTEVYRNYDHRFNQLLARSRTRRVIPASVLVEATAGGVRFSYTDCEGVTASAARSVALERAKNAAANTAALRTQAVKGGDTVLPCAVPKCGAATGSSRCRWPRSCAARGSMHCRRPGRSAASDTGYCPKAGRHTLRKAFRRRKMSPTASLRRFTATTGSGGSNGGWISRLRRRGAA